MVDKGWRLHYYNKSTEMFADRNGILLTFDMPHPFSDKFANIAHKNEMAHVHPKTKETLLYRLYEYKHGDYLVRYLLADLDVENIAVWRKVEPYERNEPDYRNDSSSLDEDTYGVYHSVPGLKAFIESYQNRNFQAVWKEYDGFLKEKYKEYLIPLKPGNAQETCLQVLQLLKKESAEEFLALYQLCNGQDEGQWLDMIEEKGIAYAHLNGYPLMMLEEILMEVKGTLELAGNNSAIKSIPPGCVKDNFMLVGKIPIHHDGGGNYTAIDLDPDVSGSYGQIVSVDHEYQEQVVLARSLKEYILILYYFVKELGVIDNGEGFDGERSLSSYIRSKE
jgi:cell wall assembly regulator SMI1